VSPESTGPEPYAASDPDASPAPSSKQTFTGLQTLRPGSAIAAGVLGLLSGLALALPSLFSRDPSWVLISGVTLGLVLLWLYVVRPCVKLHDEGVRIVNPLHTIDVTWPMITEVRSRWTLEVFAGDQKFPAWGVPADPKRPRYGRGVFSLGANKILAGQGGEQPVQKAKVEAQTVASEIEARVEADKRRKDGRTPRIAQQVWDPAPVGLLIASVAFFAIAFLL
jgi:hypothetical protein